MLVFICRNQCVKCGFEFSPLSAHTRVQKDHIVPIYLGGSDGIENLQPLCIRCNTKKTRDTTDYRPQFLKDALLGGEIVVVPFEFANV